MISAIIGLQPVLRVSSSTVSSLTPRPACNLGTHHVAPLVGNRTRPWCLGQLRGRAVCDSCLHSIQLHIFCWSSHNRQREMGIAMPESAQSRINIRCIRNLLQWAGTGGRPGPAGWAVPRIWEPRAVAERSRRRKSDRGCNKEYEKGWLSTVVPRRTGGCACPSFCDLLWPNVQYTCETLWNHLEYNSTKLLTS